MSLQKVGKRYYPRFYYKGKGQIVKYTQLDKTEQQLAYPHGKHEHVMDMRPGLKEVILSCQMAIAKFGGSFTGEEFLDVCEYARSKGMTVQWLVKEARGGGRGRHGWGTVHLAYENQIEKYLKKLDIWEEFQLIPKTKQLNRLGKLLGEGEYLPTPPRIVIGDDFPYEGLIFASPSWMKANDIPFGCKTSGVTKGLIVPLKADHPDYDVIVPKNENKFKLSAEKLAKNFKIVRRLAPEKLFSANLKNIIKEDIGRNPKHSHDLASLLNRTPSKRNLQKLKEIYQGTADPQYVADTLFSYIDRDGQKKYTKHGQMILEGTPITHPDVVYEVHRALFTCIQSAIQPRISGIYGVIMPIELLEDYGMKHKAKRIVGWYTRWPWCMPVKTTCYVWNHCIFVDHELHLCYGGDYDGDQGAVFDRHTMRWCLDWKRDKAFIKQAMAMPVKQDASDDARPYEAVIAAQLDQYSKCGATFNASKIVVDAARLAGWDQRRVTELEIRLQATEVQPYIDGIKYRSVEEKAPTPYSLCMKYADGIVARHLAHARKYFSVIRGTNACLAELLALAKVADPVSKSYYERVVSLFNDW